MVHPIQQERTAVQIPTTTGLDLTVTIEMIQQFATENQTVETEQLDVTEHSVVNVEADWAGTSLASTDVEDTASSSVVQTVAIAILPPEEVDTHNTCPSYCTSANILEALGTISFVGAMVALAHF